MTDKYTQKEIILKKLEAANDWIPAWDLEKVDTQWGWIGSSGQRRARELAQEGKIDRKIEGRYVFYKAHEVKYETYLVRGLGEQVKIRI